MPPGLQDYVQRLNEQGIVFVPASGRPLATLKEMFDWPGMDLAFISDNGAVVEVGGEILHRSVISPEQYLSMVDGTLASTDGTQCSVEWMQHTYPWQPVLWRMLFASITRTLSS